MSIVCDSISKFSKTITQESLKNSSNFKHKGSTQYCKKNYEVYFWRKKSKKSLECPILDIFGGEGLKRR